MKQFHSPFDPLHILADQVTSTSKDHQPDHEIALAALLAATSARKQRIPEKTLDHMVTHLSMRPGLERSTNLHLEMFMCGQDRPAKIIEITQLFSQLSVNVIKFDYRILGRDRKNFGLLLEVEDEARRVSCIAKRLRSGGVKMLNLANHSQLTLEVRPWTVTIAFGAPDLPGLLHDFSSAVLGSPTTKGYSGLQHQCTSWIPSVSITRLDAQLVNDALLPQGGVPGFRICVSVAARSRSDLEAAVQRVHNFRDAMVTAWVDVRSMSGMPNSNFGQSTLLPEVASTSVKQGSTPALIYAATE